MIHFKVRTSQMTAKISLTR